MVFTQLQEPYEFNVKGKGKFIEGQEYDIIAKLDEKPNPKYPNTYILQSSNREVDTQEIKKDGLIDFLKTITGEARASAMLTMYGDEIVDVLEAKDKESLMKVDGIGEKMADKIIKSYQSKGNLSLAIVELSKYNLTEKMIKKIVKHYSGNVDLAISEINENPYAMTKVSGVGFKIADRAYMYYYRDTPCMLYDKKRVLAYFDYLFQELYSSGSTWLTVNEFVDKVKEHIPQVNAKQIAEYYKEDDRFMRIKYHDGIRLTTRKNIETELFIANRLKEMLSETPSPLNNVDDIIRRTESVQGWKFDESQIHAIHAALKHNVFMLQGTAGTGKTATIKALTNIFMHNNLSFEQISLSGKAADNIRKSTGFEARTIHSLLGIMSPKPHNKENPLSIDIIIVDEISMVDAWLFSKLLDAMSPNTKLIMVGDNGQLDSIGVGVMQGMIDSGIIPTTTLSKIHRQAQESAIITHSLAFRNGKVAKELSPKSETDETYGVKQDLNYVFVKNDEEDRILHKVLEKYKHFFQKDGLSNTQIICATRSTGKVSVDKLNEYAQMISNPPQKGVREIALDDGYILREGDKVINRKNSAEFKNPYSKPVPIFNGNTGIIRQISSSYITIDFDGIDIVNIPISNINQIQLGYAITIHSSQGSTIKNVIIAMPFHFLLNSKELIYTALTRASDNAVIVTSPKSLSHALRKTSKKINKTNLEIMLKEKDISEFIL